MTHKKHEIAVFIDNEEMLREARELLEKYGGEIDEEYFNMNAKYVHLYSDGTWCTCSLTVLQGLDKTRITLHQLEEILKNQ